VNVFGQALERCATSPFGALELRAAIEDAAQPEVDRLHRLNDGLGIIAAIGPMLGLLGTVFGMIGAFHTIGGLEGAARSSELAKYMSLALVNTAEGLIVAIPCTVLFAVFRRRINALVAEAGEIIERLVNGASARTAPAVAPRGQPRAAQPLSPAVSPTALPTALPPQGAQPVRPIVEGAR
jgi:biopolymer transport protein ExbB